MKIETCSKHNYTGHGLCPDCYAEVNGDLTVAYMLGYEAGKDFMKKENVNSGYPLLGDVRELCDECDAVYDLLRKLYTKNGKGGRLLDGMIKKSNEIRKHFA